MLFIGSANLRKVREIREFQKSTVHLGRDAVVRLIFLESFDFMALDKL